MIIQVNSLTSYVLNILVAYNHTTGTSSDWPHVQAVVCLGYTVYIYIYKMLMLVNMNLSLCCILTPDI